MCVWPLENGLQFVNIRKGVRGVNNFWSFSTKLFINVSLYMSHSNDVNEGREGLYEAIDFYQLKATASQQELGFTLQEYNAIKEFTSREFGLIILFFLLENAPSLLNLIPRPFLGYILGTDVMIFDLTVFPSGRHLSPLRNHC